MASWSAAGRERVNGHFPVGGSSARRRLTAGRAAARRDDEGPWTDEDPDREMRIALDMREMADGVTGT